ncbi:serine hydrolase [Brevundimonas sp. 2R-24]|uniref:Serine hydrolase n=1 Tax=Peiella sedimenti TaxID=3061083 RepID=A0ABT8SHG7_9CAUL|nr:serine hydrolase [Caulobacteraceae bacterium XZ-24]
MSRLLIALLASSSLMAAPVPTAARTDPAAAVAPVSDADFQRASQQLLDLARAAQVAPGASPAMAVIIVRRGQAPIIWVEGRLDARGDRAADADTPFYIASQTKAYTGLLAQRLDERGVFDLDQTMTDVWPGLRMPQGVDPSAITFRQLLSHQAPFENDAITFRAAYTDLVPYADYPRLLAQASTPREAGFRYDNLGYNVYAAALHARTGKDWRDWLRDDLFQPLGMNRTSARTSDFPAAELAAYHQWMGGDDWSVTPVKPDDTMQAAGGLVTSPHDMARWLQVQLGEPNPVVTRDQVAATHVQQVAAEIRGDVVPCQGYGLGWNICRLGQADVRVHGGGYTGVRSVMAVSPDLGVGFAVLTNSDSMTGGLTQMLTQIFFESLQNSAHPAPTAEQMTAQYGRRIQRLLEGRRQGLERARADAQWGGWSWTPSASELDAYAGRYRSPTLGDLVIDREGQALTARLGVIRATLQAAQADLFGVQTGPLDAPQPVRFARGADGRIQALDWTGDRFERVE